jgi:hypothetical protein
VKFQTELPQPFLELLKEPHGIGSMLEAHHKIISIGNDDDIARCRFPALGISP